MTFWAIETAMTAGIYGALANADLTWGAYVARCIFDASSMDALAISGTGPRVRVRSVAVPDIAAGASVTVNGVAYTVSSVEVLSADELRLILVAG